MALEFTTSYLKDSLALLRQYKRLGESAIEQLTDQQLCQSIDPESNSVAIIVKHMVGNMRSRWTAFLTSDGEKPNRDRDSEFVEAPTDRKAMMDAWEHGWACVFNALEPLTDDDLARTVMIRGEAHSVMQAINRQIAHYCSHIGQIIFVSKHLAHDRWKTLSVPRNRSAEFNQKVASGQSQR